MNGGAIDFLVKATASVGNHDPRGAINMASGCHQVSPIGLGDIALPLPLANLEIVLGSKSSDS